ncbi:MAG: hypothetical protein HOK97_22765, partial [Deltaproteobacteria bacterium]|nr:hypothetical protein [Deltaproteobacteria bacterium]
ATYEPSRWSSMVHNLARMKAKDAMVALAAQSTQDISESLDHLVRGSSDEIPNITNQKKVECQWIYWYRNKEDRETLANFLGKTVLDSASLFTTAAQDKHLVLGLVLSQTKVNIGLHIAPSAEVDRRNFLAHLKDEYKIDKTLEAFSALPENMMMGNPENLKPIGEWALESDRTELEELLESDSPFFLGYVVDSDLGAEMGAELSSWVQNGIENLLPFYTHIAWSKTNDCIGQGRAVKKAKEEKIKKSANFQKGDKVRITTGLLSGNVGIIENIDAKAMVKVAVGKMSVKVPGQDLIPLA